MSIKQFNSSSTSGSSSSVKPFGNASNSGVASDTSWTNYNSKMPDGRDAITQADKNKSVYVQNNLYVQGQIHSNVIFTSSLSVSGAITLKSYSANSSDIQQHISDGNLTSPEITYRNSLTGEPMDNSYGLTDIKGNLQILHDLIVVQKTLLLSDLTVSNGNLNIISGNLILNDSNVIRFSSNPGYNTYDSTISYNVDKNVFKMSTGLTIRSGNLKIRSGDLWLNKNSSIVFNNTTRIPRISNNTNTDNGIIITGALNVSNTLSIDNGGLNVSGNLTLLNGNGNRIYFADGIDSDTLSVAPSIWNDYTNILHTNVGLTLDNGDLNIVSGKITTPNNSGISLNSNLNFTNNNSVIFSDGTRMSSVRYSVINITDTISLYSINVTTTNNIIALPSQQFYDGDWFSILNNSGNNITIYGLNQTTPYAKYIYINDEWMCIPNIV